MFPLRLLSSPFHTAVAESFKAGTLKNLIINEFSNSRHNLGGRGASVKTDGVLAKIAKTCKNLHRSGAQNDKNRKDRWLLRFATNLRSKNKKHAKHQRQKVPPS